MTETLEGTIMSYSTQSNWGFIRCPPLWEAGITDGPEKGVFFHGKDVTGGHVPRHGEEVTFVLSRAASGKPQALQVTPTAATLEAAGGDTAGAAVAGYDGEDIWEDASTAAAATATTGRLIGRTHSLEGLKEATEAHLAESRLLGHILSYNTEKAWGFVSAPGLDALVGAGKGIFFHLKDFVGDPGTLVPGLAVSFTYTVDQTGKPHATWVELMEGSKTALVAPALAPVVVEQPLAPVAAVTPPWASVAVDTVQEDAQAVQLLEPSRAAALGINEPPPPVTGSGGGDRIDGSVLAFNEQNAWGFLTAPGLEEVLGEGRGIFFHIRDYHGAGKPRIGLPVSFSFYIDDKGKPHAQDVRPAGSAARDPQQQAVLPGGAEPGADIERYEGHVQSYSVEKAWGFIGAEGLEPVLGPGKGIFFHLKDVIGGGDASVLRNGTHVSFECHTDRTGKLHAYQVQILGEDSQTLAAAPAVRDGEVEAAGQAAESGRSWRRSDDRYAPY